MANTYLVSSPWRLAAAVVCEGSNMMIAGPAVVGKESVFERSVLHGKYLSGFFTLEISCCCSL